MLPSTSTTASSAPEQPPATSGTSREPKSSSSSRENRPNSDEDEDEDDVRLTRPHLRFISEAGHDHVRDSDGPLDGPSASASSSSRPKTLDDAVVPDEVVARVLPLPFKLSLVMQNTGSVARDHLSAERTFLAYVRTSLSFASAGVGPSLRLHLPHPPSFLIKVIYTYTALVQLFRVSVSASANGSSLSPASSSYARPLGATLVGFGMAVLLIGEPSSFPFPLVISFAHPRLTP